MFKPEMWYKFRNTDDNVDFIYAFCTNNAWSCRYNVYYVYSIKSSSFSPFVIISYSSKASRPALEHT
jgi:hypothetical protein